MTLRLLFSLDPLAPARADDPFVPEARAADALGIPWSLVDHEALVNERDVARALRKVREVEPGPCLYRGWMLRPEVYAPLHEALADRGLRLVNDPAAYRHAHHLPESYPTIQPFTPRTVWLPGATPSMDEVHALLRPFGALSLVLKDYVKSQKHHWAEACFIPTAADKPAVERVVRRFLELQGPDLNEGLVFREFVELDRIGTHPRSGLPLFREHRVFILDGEPVFTCRYWDDGAYGEADHPALEPFRDVARRVRSRFFSMDVARRTDGTWIVIELGDGQVAGLPDHADRVAFLVAIRDGLARRA